MRVDAGICAGFSACLGVCPEAFALHDEGYAVVKLSEVPKELEAAVREAASQCPSGAISVSEDRQ
ncbi:MAG TPA: ferredoxin [Solimonas sp.]|nr:ferredoxin [Solimonas sp.]